MLGCTPEELGRSQLWDFVDDADRDGVVAQLAERARGIGELHEFRLRRKDGSHVWTSMATSPITQLDGTTGALAMVRDVTVAHRMEAELRESRERLDLALSAGQLGAWDTVAGGKLAISPQVREILGLAADTPLDERAAYFRYVHPDDREGLATSMQRHFAATASERFVNEYRIVRANGEVRWVRSSGGTFHSPTGETRILGTVNDITESRELQQQLQQASRLEGIGRLAGGVAHDFNNLLTAILASVRFAEMANVPGIDEELTTIRAAAERGAELTRQLLAFARKQVIELAVLDLNAIVGELAKVLRRLVGEDVELTFELGDRLWSLRGGASQLEQVIVNLVVNGSEAMPDGGRLRLVTANVQVGHVNAHVTGQGHAGVPPGDYVMFAVTDAGRGIEDAVLPHIFEPFFTTKPTGTGLGLASAYGIVQQLGGHLGVRTEPGKGSTFTVHLPRTGEQARAASPPIASSPARRSRSTLLLVEDDDLLRRVIVRGLVEAGYQVLVAADGDQALEVAASHAAPIHALITDVVMPRSSGRQLAERFASIRPETKVLFVSGYNDQIIARQNMVEPGQHFLAKPYTMEVLRQRIDELVGDGPAR
jgi:PAS domain S-box-containing protein